VSIFFIGGRSDDALQPFPEFHHPFLMAERAEMPPLAGKSQPVLMVAQSRQRTRAKS
jgi:hypothetical protein